MNKKVWAIFLSLAVILIIAGTTLALLTAQTGAKSNQFTPGVLTTTIIENGEDPGSTKEFTPEGKNTRKEVRVRNDENVHGVEGYIRVMLVPTFRTNEGTLPGNIVLHPSGNILTITAPNNGGTIKLKLVNGWKDNWIYDNGYFYHRSIVSPGKLTAVLLESVEVTDSALWNSFHLEVLSDAIQAEGGALEDAWGEAIGRLLD